jgi:hypothetical protein
MGTSMVWIPPLHRSVFVLAPHKVMPLRKAISLSGGRNRPFFSSQGAMDSMAPSFSVEGATYHFIALSPDRRLIG